MRANLVKSSLLLILLGGTIAGLLAYNQILVLLGSIFDFQYYWIYIPIIFTVSLLIARIGIRSLTQDITATNVFSEISPIMVLKFFIGGFIGCYVAISMVGSILLTLYLIFKNFF